MVLEGVIGSGSTSAIGSPVVQDEEQNVCAGGRAGQLWGLASGAGR